MLAAAGEQRIRHRLVVARPQRSALCLALGPNALQRDRRQRVENQASAWQNNCIQQYGEAPGDDLMRVLNVGGGSKEIAIPPHYAGWEHLLFDIDPRGKPDIVGDARELASLPTAQFDAVYCAHNLEHYYKHDGVRVLRGFLHVLQDDGFAEIRVPDLDSLMQHVVRSGMDVDDVLYTSDLGPITPRDVLYGLGTEIERSGRDFYAHKTGFTAKSLSRSLKQAGFRDVLVLRKPRKFELRAFAFKATSRADQLALLGLSPEGR